MIDNKKKLISRRKLIGGMGKLAYVAPTLTLFSVDANAQTVPSSPPCPPTDPCPGGAPAKQKSRTESRSKKKPEK